MYEVGDMRMVAIHTSVMQVCFGIGIFAWSGELCDVTLPLLGRLNLVCGLAGAPGISHFTLRLRGYREPDCVVSSQVNLECFKLRVSL